MKVGIKMRRLGLIAALCLLPSICFAAKIVEVYECNFGSHRPMLPDNLMFIYHPDTGEVFVYDNYIHAEIGEPIPARVTANNKTKLTFLWSLRLTDRTGTPAKVSYRVAYFKARKSVNISAQAMGYTNQSTNRAQCRMSKEKLG